jgi:hypothetical protein
MSKITVGLILGSLLLAFGGGYYLAKKSVKPAKPIVITQVKEIEKVVTKTVTKERVVTRDGTVTEREVTADTVADKSLDKVLTALPNPPQWSLGLRWSPVSYVPVEAEIGRRLLGNVWITAGANWYRSTHFLLGIRYDF